MPIQFPPDRGEILICDFSGLLFHEMEKTRPVIVLSPKISSRAKLATVVCLSTTEPSIKEDYHLEITFDPPYSPKFPSSTMWLKGDMIYSLNIDRMTRPHIKDEAGKRTYPIRKIDRDLMLKVERCVLNGIGLKVDRVPEIL